MTKTQRIDALRNIRKQIASFLSIVIIAMLAVVAYLGIVFSATALDRNVSAYYNGLNTQDLQVISPLLLTTEDVAAILDLDGVEDAEGSFTGPAWLSGETGLTQVSLLSMPERIAMPEILDGRPPQTEREVMVEKGLADAQGIGIGEEISLQAKSGGTPALLKEPDFTVVGIFYHPDHISYKIPETPYVILLQEAFDQSLLEGAFPQVRLKVAGLPANRFSDAYGNGTKAVEQALALLSAERSPKRGSDLYERYQKIIADGETQLQEAQTILDDADRQLKEGETRLEDAERQIAEGEHQILDVEQQLQDAQQLIEEGEQKLREEEEAHADDIARLADARAQLETAATTLGIAPEQLDAVLKQLENAAGQLESGAEALEGLRNLLDIALISIEAFYDDLQETGKLPDPETIAQYKAAAESIGLDVSRIPDEFPKDLLTWDADAAIAWLKEVSGYNIGEAAYQEKLAEYQAGLLALEYGRSSYYYMGEEYLDGLAAYEKGLKEVAEGERKLQELYDARDLLEEKKAELEEGRRQLEAKKAELEEGKTSAEAGRTELEAKRKEYERGLQELNQYRAQIESARAMLEKMDGGVWTVLNSRAASGYVYCEENSSNLSSLSLTFSLIFIVVAALVIYSSVGRMVDEQSVLVGATKAMGLYNREILLKYMSFGVLATGIGLVLGLLLARFALEPLVLGQYNEYYNTSVLEPAFLPLQTLFVFAGGLALAAFSVWFAISRLLRSTAVKLMSGEGPMSRLRSGHAGTGSLYSRLILLNMSSDLKRVFVTIVSIAGCCVLLAIGFTMKYGMDRLSDRQFGGVMTFDAELSYDEDAPGAEDELWQILDRYGAHSIRVYQESRVISLQNSFTSGTVIVADPDEITGYYHLRDIKTGKTIPLAEHGVLLPKRLNEVYRLGEDDELAIYDENLGRYEVQAAGVFDNYFATLLFLSPDSYREVFGSAAKQNCFLVKLNGADFQELNRALRSVPGFLSLKDAAAGREDVQTTARALNLLIVLMIVMAGMMACFILVNLSSSYMIHKKKELTVMRINGFSVSECIRYAATELVVTSVIGILLGIPSGLGLGYLVIRATEQSFLQMDRTVDPRTVLFSVLITAGFSLIINFFVLRKIRRLKLSDV